MVLGSRSLLCLAVSLVATALGTNEVGLAFLKENGAKEGVVTLPSGLQYKKITTSAKEGALTPTASSPCECHYAGTLIDGTEFDSSIKRGKPATFAPNQVIKGWTEAMQLMREGDKWELYIPSELAYGDRNRGKFIKAGDVLVFTLELIKVNSGGFVKAD
jgi:FKBP-type peptidyl-prolyl cis-trans isomerase FklB